MWKLSLFHVEDLTTCGANTDVFVVALIVGVHADPSILAAVYTFDTFAKYYMIHRVCFEGLQIPADFFLVPCLVLVFLVENAAVVPGSMVIRLRVAAIIVLFDYIIELDLRYSKSAGLEV